MDARILRAISVAADNHEGQRYNDLPYIVHPLTVGMILLDLGASPAVVVAGILHDTLEDTDLTYEAIEIDFGEDVATIVDEVTRGDETYEEYLDGITSPGGQLVKVTDSMLNLAGLHKLEDPERRARLRTRYTANLIRFAGALIPYNMTVSNLAGMVEHEAR